jgi:hypothetical protein
VHAAIRAEIVLRNVPVELVDAELLEGCSKLEVGLFDAVNYRAFLRADGAIADDALGRIQGRSKSNLAAVA